MHPLLNDFANKLNAGNPFMNYLPLFYPKGGHHIGCDLKVPIGTPIYAPTDGEMYVSVWSNPKGNTGVFIFTDESGQMWGLELCHLSELPKKGNYTIGQQIAISGATGSACAGAHLHFVMHKDAKVTANYSAIRSPNDTKRLVAEGKIINGYEYFKRRILVDHITNNIA
jgi:murein DD-endopeptidase MepM/ murein hydrolase activator NlpD